jgi:hypothetical protein
VNEVGPFSPVNLVPLVENCPVGQRLVDSDMTCRTPTFLEPVGLSDGQATPASYDPLFDVESPTSTFFDTASIAPLRCLDSQPAFGEALGGFGTPLR